MFKSKIWKPLLLVIMLILVLVLSSCVSKELAEEGVLCYTYDSNGNLIKGYYDSQEDIWYLFLTSSQKISDTEVYFTEDILSSECGTADTDADKIKGAFSDSGDMAKVTMEDGSVKNIAVMQSDLPSVYIDLKNTTFDEIHSDKDKKHAGNSVYITSAGGEYDLTVRGSVEIKGRGNSSWLEYEKKAYQIKFTTKTSVLGMEKAKKWVLLANASDDSMMRTKLVYNMAEKLDMGFVADLEYVDLWIEGEYRGTFLLGEKVETNSARLGLENEYGALFEHDEAFWEEEDYRLYSKMLQRHFVLKDIVTEEVPVIADAMVDFESAVDEFTSYLYSTPSSEVTLEKLSTMIDIDSFIKYFLVNEYTQNRESFATSFYWYKDGFKDVIHLGPIWDFDTCMGNDGALYTEYYGSAHVMFRYLFAVPEFYSRAQEIYEQYKVVFTSMAEDVDAIKEEIADSAEMNYIRWRVLGTANPKKDAVDFYPTFDKAVEAVKNWLTGRAETFTVNRTNVVTSRISEGCYEMDITYETDSEYGIVKFVVWSLADGQDDMTWYDAQKQEDGTWTFTVNLADHASSGIYRIDVYGDGIKNAVATGYNYVDTICEQRYDLTAVVAEDCTAMELIFKDSGLCKDVSFAVWSDEGAQDDIKWYNAEKNSDGLWHYTVNLRRHETAGTYYIHAYTSDGDGRKLIDSTTAEVAFAVMGARVEAEFVNDNTELELTLTTDESYTAYRAAVWSNDNNQADLKWFDFTKDTGGTWKCTVPLTDFTYTGDYNIHVYAIDGDKRDFVAHTEVYVDQVVFETGEEIPDTESEVPEKAA